MKSFKTYSIRAGVVALSLSGAALWAAEPTPSGAATETSPGWTGSRMETKDERGGTRLSHQDVQFIQKTAEQNLAGIALGFLAIEKGASDEIKDHGRALIDEAVKSNKELMELASRKNVFVALDEIKLSDEDLKRISEKPGKEFDTAFVVAIVNNGTKSQAGLQESLAQISDSEVKDFAGDRLSDINKQISDARDLGNNIGIAADRMKPLPVAEGPSPEAATSPRAPAVSPMPETDPLGKPMLDETPHHAPDMGRPTPMEKQPEGTMPLEAQPSPGL